MAFDKDQFMSEQFISIFDNLVVQDHIGERTVAEYLSRIRCLYNYTGKDFLATNKEDALKYFEKMWADNMDGKLKNSSIYSRWTCYNRIGNFIEANYDNLFYENPFKDIPRERRINKVEYSCNRIPGVRDIDIILSNTKNEMYYLIFSLAFRVALSVYEITNLTLNNVIETQDGRLALRVPKRDSIILLPEDVSALLREYLVKLPYTDEQKHLFCNKMKHPVNENNISKYLSRIIAKNEELQQYTMRDFRSRGILDILLGSARNDGDISTVSDYVGVKEPNLKKYIASGTVVGSSPADLVSIRVKEF